MTIDDLIKTIRFDERGLVPAIIQDSTDGRVLMLGYMNADSLRRTWEERRAVFFSRSRQELWRKGDTSGNVQLVESISFDCDADALLVAVEQVGVACHNGTRSCFDTGSVTLDD